VLLVASTTPPERRGKIVTHATGFIYCISVTGITGERTAMPEHLAAYVRGIKSAAKVPVCIGFGIATPEHVAAVAPLADGVIVGSAVVRRIAEHGKELPGRIASAVADLCAELAAPLRK
jgi:tryptophan synthase alpha chain